MTRQVVQAVQDSGVYAILCKGWSDRGSSKDKNQDTSEGADGVTYPDEILYARSLTTQCTDLSGQLTRLTTRGCSLRSTLPATTVVLARLERRSEQVL